MKKTLISLSPVIFLCFLAAVVYFGVSGCRFLGLVILASAGIWALFLWLMAFRKSNKKVGAIMIWVLAIALVIGVAAATATGVVVAKAEKGSADTPCDYMIVLGAGVNGTVPSRSLQERINAAYTYLENNPNTICIVSGGKGSGERITEAQCMFNELTKMGVAENRILLEEKADSTWKNIIFSMELIETTFGQQPKTVGILSSDYHLYRAGLYAREAGLSPVCIPAETTWWHLHLCYFLREIVALWGYWIL